MGSTNTSNTVNSSYRFNVIRKVRAEFAKSIPNKLHFVDEDIKRFESFAEKNYGIKFISNNEGYTGEYIIINESKYNLFILKHGY